MQVSQSMNAYTASLFQGAIIEQTASQPAAKTGPASYFAPAVQTELSGIYSDPRIALADPVALSDSTKRILDKINSLINNELKTISTTYHKMAEADTGRELPENPKYSDFTTEERMSLSEETRSAERFKTSFGIWSHIATMDPSNLKGRGFMIGEQFLDMTETELAEKTISGFVNTQIQAAQRVIEMTRSDEFATFSDGTENPTGPVHAMTPEEVETMRSDLLAKWTDAYDRGEINLTLQVFSSGHAVNYDKAYKTLNMATGDFIVTTENSVVFDEAWEFSEARKTTMERLMTGVGGSQFLDGLGEYAEEYLKDLSS